MARYFNENINDIILKVAHRSSETKLYWYLDSRFIGMTDTFHEIALQPVPGKFVLTVVDQEGNQIHRKLEVAVASGS